MCSAKIRHGRARDIARAAEVHQAGGGGLLFITLTAPHDLSMPLTECWDLVRIAFGEIMRGRHRATLRDRFGVEGFVRATETTYGRAGWHVHQHVLVFTDRPWDDLERITELWRWIHERWARRVEAHGGRRPSLARGVQVIPCRADNTALAQYIASVNGGIASEVAQGDDKTARAPGSRTPMQLLADHADTLDPRDWTAWMEWVKGSHGRRLIEWSQGLRGRLLGDDDAPSDDDLVAEADRAETVVDVPRETWRALLIARCTVEVLTIAEQGARALVDALNRWGVPVWLDSRGRGSPPVLRTRTGGSP